MGYFEEKMGLPPSEYSPEFLELEAEAGPWLERSQQRTPINKDAFPRWDLDLDEKVIWFGDHTRNGLVASVQVLGTYHVDNGTWLWAWSNPKLKESSTAVRELTAKLEEVPEIIEPVSECSLAKAWALAAVAAHEIESETCFCLPGDAVNTFVALFDVTVLEPADPRSIVPVQDSDAAHEALSEYVGPAVLHLGGMLLDAAKSEPLDLDPVIEATHVVCDNLESLSRSPVGRNTPAAGEAMAIAQSLREAVLGLSLPPMSPALVGGVKDMMALLGELAARYGAVSDA